MDERHKRGRDAEALAQRHLQRRGLTAVTSNYRCRRGEIDLVMRDGDALVFVEVRFRSDPRFGAGAESVDLRKQARLIAAASHYLQRHPADGPVRFDVVAVAPGRLRPRIDWIRDAFRA